MSDSNRAAEAMGAGYNCAQAVSTTYGVKYGVPEETIARIASGFGGGVGRTDNICGAVSGAVMVLGLKYGPKSAADKEAKTKASIKTGEFIREYERRFGAVSCTGLLGYNISLPEGREKVLTDNAFAKCRDVVRNAGKLLEEFLEAE